MDTSCGLLDSLFGLSIRSVDTVSQYGRLATVKYIVIVEVRRDGKPAAFGVCFFNTHIVQTVQPDGLIIADRGV